MIQVDIDALSLFGKTRELVLNVKHDDGGTEVWAEKRPRAEQAWVVGM